MPSAKLFVFFLQAVHPLFTEFKLVRPSFQTLHHLGYSSPLHRRPGQSEGVQNEARGPDVTRRVWAEGLLVPETAGRLQMHTRLFFNLKNPTIVVALCQCGVTNQKVHLGFYFSNSQQVRVRVSPSRGIFRARRPSCSWHGAVPGSRGARRAAPVLTRVKTLVWKVTSVYKICQIRSVSVSQ